MRVSNYGIADLMAHEGIVPFRYRDSVKVDTWGVGHTHNAGPPDPRAMPFAKEYPMTEVVDVFRRDLAKFESRVRAAVKVPVKQHEFDALVSFDFNTGGIHRAKLTASLNAGNRAEATKGFMGWTKPAEIIPRRKKEQSLFAGGSYSSGGMANVYPADAKGKVLFAKGKRINVMSAIGGIVAANESDAKADQDRNKGVATGAGGAASGGATQAPDTALPDMPADPAMFKWFLLAVAVVLAGAAIAYFVRSGRRRKDAKAQSDAAAVMIEADLLNAPDAT